MTKKTLARLTAVSIGLFLITATLGLAAPSRAKLGPFAKRLIRGSSVEVDSSGRPAPMSQAELRHLAKFLVIDPDSNPPRARIRLQLDHLARSSIEAMGIKTYGRLSGFATAIVPIPRLKAISEVAGVSYMQIGRVLEKELNVSRVRIDADDSITAFGTTGSDVIVASVDTGYDVTHDDFRNANGSTRFLYIWSQDDDCVGSSPAPPFDFGCLYSEDDINDFLNSIGLITSPDGDGHGTHVLSTAGGNGNATGNGQPANTYVGIAPEANLIGVKTFPEPGDMTDCLTCFELGLGLEFIDAKATELGMPYAANLSLGHNFGGHDGTDIDELVIDTLTGPGIPGRVIVKSAGNNRGAGIHASGTVAEGETDTHTFTIPIYTPLPDIFDDLQVWQLWYQGGDSLTVSILDPPNPCLGDYSVTLSTGGGHVDLDSDSGTLLIDDSDSPAPNGDRFFDMEVDDQLGTEPCHGTWTVEVTGDTITEGGRYDMWIWFSSFGAGGAFSDWNVPDLTQLISIPGTAFNATTVAAYITKKDWFDIDGNHIGYSLLEPINELAPFSSPGPSRDGRLKPEIAAPGMGIAAALSDDAAPDILGGGARIRVVQDGVHWVIEGTSMSAPHVTGVYAQMLDFNPNLDAIQLRTVATSTATTDTYTGAVPNDDWGYGKINALAAINMLGKHVADLTFSDASTGNWTGISTADTYNVYRTDVSNFDGVFFGSCHLDGLATPTFTDTDTPALGHAFIYWVTGVKDGIEGVVRFDENGDPQFVPPGDSCL